MSKKRIVKKWDNRLVKYWYYAQVKHGPFWFPLDEVGWPTQEQAMRELEHSNKSHPTNVVYEE